MEQAYKNNLKILSWAEEDRPREKLITKGRAALSDAELLGILLGSGTVSLSAVDVARLILQEINHDLNQLARMTVKDLQKFKGIGEAKAITIISALELGRRRKETEPVKKEKITCSEDAYRLMKPNLLDLQHEEFWVLLLNRSNIVIKKAPVSSGGVTGTIADPRLILRLGLENLASGIILVHNHPSGNLKPSQADIILTEKVKQGGKFMDIPVMDHIIFTDHSYYSFADEGIL